MIIDKWIGAAENANVMAYIDLDWHDSNKRGDTWELTFSVNDGGRPRFGKVTVNAGDVNGSYGSRQIVPGHARRSHDGKWVLWYLTLNGTDYPVQDGPNTRPVVSEVEAYFTNDFRTLADGTVEQSLWVRSGEYGRDYYWIRYPRGVEPPERLKGAEHVTVDLRLASPGEGQDNSCGFAVIDGGEYEIVTDVPQHKLARAAR